MNGRRQPIENGSIVSSVGGSNCCNVSGSIVSLAASPFWKSTKLVEEVNALSGTLSIAAG